MTTRMSDRGGSFAVLTKQKADTLLRAYGRMNRCLGPLAMRPILYFLYITERCNLNCSYCWQRMDPPAGDRGREGGEELSADEWCRVISRLPGRAAVGFSGGEPLLIKGFDRIFTQAAQKSPVTINSNGVLLTERMSSLFVEKGLRNLSISLDGFRDVHDASRGRAGLFDKTVGNIKTFNEIRQAAPSGRPALTIKTTLLDKGVADLAEFCAYCDTELQADTVNISLAKTVKHAQFSHRLYDTFADLRTAGVPKSIPYSSHERIVQTLTGLLANYARGRMRITLYPVMHTARQIAGYLGGDGKDVYHRCCMPWAMTVILAGGDVIPCLSVPLGNVRDVDYDIRKILSGNAVRRFRKTLGRLQRNGRTLDVCNCCCFLRVQ